MSDLVKRLRENASHELLITAGEILLRAADRIEELEKHNGELVCCALRAIRAAGWAVVPKDPNKEMCLAAKPIPIERREYGETFHPTGHEAADIYRAMLAAAPDPLTDD